MCKLGKGGFSNMHFDPIFRTLVAMHAQTINIEYKSNAQNADINFMAQNIDPF